MIGVTVLGSTGSVGVSTLDVLGRHRDKYRVIALSAYRDVDGLFRQCLQHQPQYAVMVAAEAAEKLRVLIEDAGVPTEVLSGERALIEGAELPATRYVMAAIVGAAGLLPTLAAVRAGKRVSMASAPGHATWSFLNPSTFKPGSIDGWAGFVIALGNFEGTFYRYAKRATADANWTHPPQELP